MGGFLVLVSSSQDVVASLEDSGSRLARWATLATMKPSRRWGTRILDVGYPSPPDVMIRQI